MIVTPVLCSDLVDRFQQYLHIQVGIHPLRQRHGTGVAYDLLIMVGSTCASASIETQVCLVSCGL